jgi:hypothetical protein
MEFVEENPFILLSNTHFVDLGLSLEEFILMLIEYFSNTIVNGRMTNMSSVWAYSFVMGTLWTIAV